MRGSRKSAPRIKTQGRLMLPHILLNTEHFNPQKQLYLSPMFLTTQRFCGLFNYSKICGVIIIPLFGKKVNHFLRNIAYCSIQYPFCGININNHKNTLLLFTVRAYLFLLYSCFLILKLVSFLVNQQFESSKSLILSHLFIQRLHCRDFILNNYISYYNST